MKSPPKSRAGDKKPKGGRTTPTMKDVARLAGVAPATVSNVLTGSRSVTDALRKRVLKAVKALGYRPNQVAASLRTRQTLTIGIVVPDVANPFFATLVHHIEEHAAASNYQSLLVGSNETESREAERIQALVARRIDGLIVAPTRDKVSESALAHRAWLPTVLVDRGFGVPGFDTFAADNIDGGYRGTCHLLELGHRDIAILATDASLGNIAERIEGYRRALTDAGYADRIWVVHGGSTIECCRNALTTAFNGRRPTAVFGTAYVATLGAVQAIRATGLAFPAEISLLGFDDSDWMTALRPNVSTIRQPIREISELSWNQLHARLTGKANGYLRQRLPCTLEVRESTVAAPAKRPSR